MKIINNFLEHLGRFTLLIISTFHRPERRSMYWKELVRQMDNIGIGSLTIIAIMAVFIGAVTAVQFAYQMTSTTSTVPKYFLSYIIRDSMIIELAPTISCIILAGKVGSNLSSELGSMRISEQIDALDIMGLHTSTYLVLPKILGAMIVVPCLVIVAAFLGICGGYVAGVYGGWVNHAEFMQGLTAFFVPFNLTMMLIKSLTFSFIFSSIACYMGYNVKGGALALGEASTSAVVSSSILILLSDYVIALLLT